MHQQEHSDRPLKARERHQLRKRSFDAAARLYDRFRPGYPEPLFDDLVELSGIPEGGRVLEIGPGTGQATLPLARRGFSILGLELGASMARLCRKNLAAFPKVEILTTAFEDWTCDAAARKTGTVSGKQGLSRAESSRIGDRSAPSPTQALSGPVPASAPQGSDAAAGDTSATRSSRRSVDVSPPRDCPSFSALPGIVPCLHNAFDMVLAATAFHWIPYKVAYPRCAKALKPHGSLALLWNFVDMPDTRFHRDLQGTYHSIVPRMHLSAPPEQRVERQQKKIVSSGLFGPVTTLRYPWQKEYDADGYIGLLKTMSDHAILAANIRREIFRAIRKLIADNGGSFVRPVIAVLFLAPKR
jgi:SAM-dependent methyltransferase